MSDNQREEMLSHLQASRESAVTFSEDLLENLEEVMEPGESETLDGNQAAISVFADILGDEEVARAFVNAPVALKFDMGGEPFVISPVLWGMLSLVPQDFGARHFVILLHLIRLKAMLKQSHSEMAETFSKEILVAKLEYQETKREAFVRAKSAKKTDKEATSLADKYSAELFARMSALIIKKDKSLSDIDVNIRYVKDVVDSIRGFVRYMGDVGGVAPTFSHDQLLAIIKTLSSNS